MPAKKSFRHPKTPGAGSTFNRHPRRVTLHAKTPPPKSQARPGTALDRTEYLR